MPPPFHRLTLNEFARLLDSFPFTRRINAVHMHHTWRPSHSQYRGEDSIKAMWNFHTQTNHWSDIAQHITIAPNGDIWTGRNWNLPPASAAGHNGSRQVGPFMFEMVGDFDHGRDPFQDPQRRVALQVIALVQKKFNLPPHSLRFHNQMSPKSCPGNSIDYEDILREITELHSGIRDFDLTPEATRRDGGPFDAGALAIRAVLQSFSRDLPASDPADAELDEDEAYDVRLWTLAENNGGRGRDGVRSAPLTPEILDELRPHVINLTQGAFSENGQFTTSAGDVDAIFEQRLVRELDAAKARKEPLRLLFFAHGGLVKESSGLRIALKHVDWWKRNHVYPIYFVWETGLFETLGQILRRSRQEVRGVTRDIFDFTTDPVVEELARSLYGPRIWSGMKRSAELAVAGGGGALYVARKLKEFCDQYQAKFADGRDLIELHAVGHSAGSIFHAHFIPKALDEGAPHFKSAQFLAPAIRVDTFHQQLTGRIGKGKGVEHLTVFTMNKNRERDDDCNGVYRKSLLYLIYHALEAERKTPILGLEVSLRDDPALKNLFGLGAAPSEAGEVVWSTTALDQGRSASRAVRHGDFDDDPPTMNSVARRVLGVDDNDAIENYPIILGERGLSSWEDQIDWPEDSGFPFGEVLPEVTPVPSVVKPPAPIISAPAPLPVVTAGRRRALCVGINQYPTAPLYGCVADAQEWRETLRGLGFSDIRLLLDGEATRAAILGSLEELIAGSAAGDVVVFQYSGHGTQLPDADGDEASGDTPETDEAICPVDFADGPFVIDDDIGAIFDRIPAGVNVTCFIDCCHSGTISRFGVGAATSTSAGRRGPIPRFLVATPSMIAAHRQFRQRHKELTFSATRRSTTRRSLSTMKEVLFAACLSSEVAYERDGHGDFTVRATEVLRSGAAALTNEQFEERVVNAFGAAALQHPRLYCRPEDRTLALLQPLTSPATVAANGAGRNGAALTVPQPAITPQVLRLMASILEGRG